VLEGMRGASTYPITEVAEETLKGAGR
jgi:hypothetical protein